MTMGEEKRGWGGVISTELWGSIYIPHYQEEGGPKVNPGWMLKEGEKAEKGRDGGLREFRGKTEKRKRKKYKHKRTYFVEMLMWGLGRRAYWENADCSN